MGVDVESEELAQLAERRKVLGAAKVQAKVSRENLSRASLEVKHGIAVWKNAQKKKSISSTLDILKKLQSARRMRGMWGCVIRVAATGDPSRGFVSRDANDLLCDIAEQMYETVLSMTTQFDAVRYSSLLEGYSYITDSSRVVGGGELSPTQEIISAYTSSPYAKVKKVIAVCCIANKDDLNHAERMMEGIREALPRGKRLVWNEISGSLMNVLQAVKLGHGENFIVVSKWVNTFLNIGHAFSGENPEALQAILSQQALRFFKGHHLNSIEALQIVLERETYKVIDIELPWLQENGSAVFVKDYTDISDEALDDLMTQSNPWNTDSEDVLDMLSHVKAVFRQKSVVLGDGKSLQTINSLWRLIKWMMEYVSLMKDLPSATPAIATGLTELVDIFILHVYSTFVGHTNTRGTVYSSESLDEYIHFMRETSLGKYKSLFQSSSPESALVGILSHDKPVKNSDKFSQASSISNSGNLYGFVERIITCNSLRELGEFLKHLAVF
eukprot:jgi/Picre1/30628/NNA_005989.t1